MDENPLVTRLRAERDRLRNEVVALRGDKAHQYELDTSEGHLMRTNLFQCQVCGKATTAPVHAYFDPCPGSS